MIKTNKMASSASTSSTTTTTTGKHDITRKETTLLETMAGLLAHGAGAGSDSSWMKSWAVRLNEIIKPTQSFDFTCM